MEHTMVEVLDDNVQAARSVELERLFCQHRTRPRADRKPRAGPRGLRVRCRRLPLSRDREHRAGGQGQRQGPTTRWLTTCCSPARPRPSTMRSPPTRAWRTHAEAMGNSDVRAEW